MAEDHRQNMARPGVGIGGFLPLPPRRRDFVDPQVVSVGVEETPAGVVVGPSRRGLVLSAAVGVGILLAFTLTLIGVAALTGTWGHTVMRTAVVASVVCGLFAILVGGAVMNGLSKTMAGQTPLLVEHLHEGEVELPRLGLRFPARSIARVQTASGWVARHDEGREPEHWYVSQLILIVDEQGAARRVLLGSTPRELTGEARRLGRSLARHLGVPHEHIQVRVRGFVKWDDLFCQPAIRCEADDAHART